MRRKLWQRMGQKNHGKPASVVGREDRYYGKPASAEGMREINHIRKGPCSGKINRLVALLLVLIGIMVIVILFPSWQRFRFRSEKTACIQALKSAEDGLIIDFLSHYEERTVEGARETLDSVLPERPNICPAGGTVYLIKGPDGIYQPVCGLHDSDLKERTRLNASRSKDLLVDALAEAKRKGGESKKKKSDSIVIRINGRDLECVRTEQEADIRRGTRTTLGYKGVVAFYGMAGEGAFEKVRAKNDGLAYFLYADEEYCAVWRVDDGWTGTAYSSY